MNKLLLYILSIILIGLVSEPVFAQCTIDETNENPGIYPDSLIHGCVDVPYSEVVQIVFPTDTTVNVFPFGNITVDFDSFVLETVTNIPPGMDFLCNPTSCKFIPPGPGENARGCVELFGLPTAPFDDSVSITATVYFEVPIFGTQSETITQNVPASVLDEGNIWSVNTTQDSVAGSFRGFIDGACPNDTIRFDQTLMSDTIQLAGPEIMITSNLTIEGFQGQNVQIAPMAGDGLFQIFNNQLLTIKFITIVESQGQVVIENAGILEVNNVNIQQ